MANVTILVQLVLGIMQVNILVQNVIQNVLNVICLTEISALVVTLIANGLSLTDKHARQNVLLVNMEIGRLINVYHAKLLVKVANKHQMIVILVILNQHKNFLCLDNVKTNVISDILFH